MGPFQVVFLLAFSSIILSPLIFSFRKNALVPDAHFATLWQRLGASIIDVLINVVVVVLVIYAFFPSLIRGDDLEQMDLNKVQYVSLLFGILYQSILECSSMQGTIGKYALGIKVTNLEGGRVNFRSALGRNYSKFILGSLFLASYIAVLFSKNKQCLHDRCAKTVVVIRPKFQS